MAFEDYLRQGELGVSEAKRILPLLEEAGIRFQIDTDLSCGETDQGLPVDRRIELFVHHDDLETWLRIMDEFWKP